MRIQKEKKRKKKNFSHILYGAGYCLFSNDYHRNYKRILALFVRAINQYNVITWHRIKHNYQRMYVCMYVWYSIER